MAFHLQGAQGGAPPTTCPKPWQAPCLSAPNFAMLHTNAAGPGGPYAMGLVNFGPSGKYYGNNALWHNGALAGWYTYQWALPGG